MRVYGECVYLSFSFRAVAGYIVTAGIGYIVTGYAVCTFGAEGHVPVADMWQYSVGLHGHAHVYVIGGVIVLPGVGVGAGHAQVFIAVQCVQHFTSLAAHCRGGGMHGVVIGKQ